MKCMIEIGDYNYIFNSIQSYFHNLSLHSLFVDLNIYLKPHAGNDNILTPKLWSRVQDKINQVIYKHVPSKTKFSYLRLECDQELCSKAWANKWIQDAPLRSLLDLHGDNHRKGPLHFVGVHYHYLLFCLGPSFRRLSHPSRWGTIELV